MNRDYDRQLLEAVAVRRRRLRDALLLGSYRTQRCATDLTVRLVTGLFIGALVATICVGVSFVRHEMRDRAGGSVMLSLKHGRDVREDDAIGSSA